MTSQYQTSRQVFTADEYFALGNVPRYLRSVEAVCVNDLDETDGWRLTAHRSEYRQALKIVKAAILHRAALVKVRAIEARYAAQ
ncbi:MAG: hypothetical protein P1U65_07465 [Minwuia sp.]|nr:hypothetical protein [Minwuia sp.]